MDLQERSRKYTPHLDGLLAYAEKADKEDTTYVLSPVSLVALINMARKAIL